MRHNIQMKDGRRVRQPRSFERFRCLAADCEDTCCVGWGVPVDRDTYQKFQNAPVQISGRSLGDLVEINAASTSPSDYARLRLENAACPALQEKLCAIQTSLGESYMPELCVKYPRVFNVLGDTLERSLHLSCPEAARLVLRDSDGMAFEDRVEQHLDDRPSLLNFTGDDPGCHLSKVRALLFELIQERSFPLWQRIGAIGSAVESVAGLDPADAVPRLEQYLKDFRNGSFHAALAAPEPDSKFQLETILEVVVTRLSSDYTPRRFLDCWRDFMLGLNWTPDATIEDLVSRYNFASQRYFLPFVGQYPHFFENYLINYIFRTVFPYRSKLPGRKFAMDASLESMRHSFVLLALHYAILRTVLIGMSALQRDHLHLERAIFLVQAYSKAFVHSTSFDDAAYDYLRKTVPEPAAKIAQLVMDSAEMFRQARQS